MAKIKRNIKSLDNFNEFTVDHDPVSQFNRWYQEATGSGVVQPDAMSLSTAGKSAQPTCRIVLLKEVNDRGFVFFTNYLSFKAKEIGENSLVALTFHWKEMQRQVRILGKATKVSGKESDAYFDTRSFDSQVSAIISEQSSVVPDRQYLEDKASEFIRINKQKKLKRPDHWGGYRVKPFQIEFWQERDHRLHDRIQYRLDKKKWVIERLAP
jgi:pyridoxamine 5'-phosphate oxidase